MSQSQQSVMGMELSSIETPTSLEVVEKGNGEAYVSRSLHEIQQVQNEVTLSLGLEQNSREAVEATDDALVAIAEHAIEAGKGSVLAEDATGNVLVETALELEGGRSVADTPVADLEHDGYDSDVARAVADLFSHHVVLPSGYEAAPLVARAVEELSMNPTLTSQPGEVEYVTNPGRRQEDIEREFLADLTISSIEALTQTLESQAYQKGIDSIYDSRRSFAKLLESVEWAELSSVQEQRLLYAMCGLDARLDNISRDPELTHPMWTVEALNKFVPSEVVGRMYDSKGPDGEDSILKRYVDTVAVNELRAPAIATTLSKVYEAEGGVVNIEEGRDEGLDRLRDFLSETELAIVSIPERPRDPTDQESVRDFRERVGNSVREIWSQHFNLSTKMGKAFGRAVGSRMTARLSEGELAYDDGRKVKNALLQISFNVEEVGTEMIERLHNELGIVNLDNYEPDDLENLSKFLDKDEEYIEHLQGGDVSVLFADAYGDHNGALGGAYDAYRKSSGRTLMFEIAEPGDFYRRMVQLKALNVRPSTLIVAAHGSPTLTHFGKPSNGFVLSVGRHVPADFSMVETKLPLGEARIDRLTSDEFMQANKGIDSPAEQIGRREIIVHSCSSDVEYVKGVPSTAEVVARATGRQDVDVFGAADVMYLQSDARGVRFEGRVEGDSADGGEYQNIATKVTIGGKEGMFDKLARTFARSDMSESYGVPSRLQKFSIKRTRVDHIPVYNDIQEGVA
ncbi:MAG: hypothetical protein ACOH18_03640 [Candidatus Saccharimonadaceae bacterium]